MTGLRVVIADDSVLLREGMAKLLASRGFDPVAQAGDGDELLRKVAGHAPDVAIVDIRMPPTGTDEGLRAAESLGATHPEVGVLVLSDHLEPHYATRLLEAGTPGRGYLLKESVTDLDAFDDALRRVAAGETVVDPSIVRRLLERVRRKDPLALLTGRERDILALMAEGRSNRAIAETLMLSERTIESHIGSVMLKLGLQNAPGDHRRVLAVLAYLRA
jgi:DNA-binding NarL/FixJ family response regulator